MQIRFTPVHKFMALFGVTMTALVFTSPRASAMASVFGGNRMSMLIGIWFWPALFLLLDPPVVTLQPQPVTDPDPTPITDDQDQYEPDDDDEDSTEDTDDEWEDDQDFEDDDEEEADEKPGWQNDWTIGETEEETKVKPDPPEFVGEQQDVEVTPDVGTQDPPDGPSDPVDLDTELEPSFSDDAIEEMAEQVVADITITDDDPGEQSANTTLDDYTEEESNQ